MKTIDRDTFNVIMPPEEKWELSAELEDVFGLLDTEIAGKMYSGNNIKERWPRLWQLFRLT